MNGSGQTLDSSDSVVCHQFGTPPTPLEARLLAAESARDAAEAARDAAEERALRAEADAHRLRQKLTFYGEKLLVEASNVPGSNIAAAPTINDSASTLMGAAPPPTVHRNEATGAVVASERLATMDRGSEGSAPATSPLNSSDHPPAKRSRRIWTFNPKWRVGRDWLEYDTNAETMGCTVCRLAGESGKWARTGITRMRLEAITSHANDQKHQRHVADAEAQKLSAAHQLQQQQRRAMPSAPLPAGVVSGDHAAVVKAGEHAALAAPPSPRP